MKTKLIAFINATHNNNLRKPKCDGVTYLSCGYANGYVAVPPGHPAHGIDDLMLCDYINVHGGATFAWPAVYPEMRGGCKINPAYKCLTMRNTSQRVLPMCLMIGGL